MTTDFLAAALRHLRRRAGPPDAGLSDRLLLERFAASRDEAAFAALVSRHGPLVLGVCRRVLGHAPDAEDAFQATFLVLARKAASVRWGESVGNWLYEVAHRLAAEVRGKAARRQARRREMDDVPEPARMPEAYRRELAAVLEEELYRLPPAYRAAVLLCCLEGHTRDEAARRLGCTPRVVKRRLERGRELLRARLTRRGWEPSAVLAAATLGAGDAPALPAGLASATAAAARTFLAGGAATRAATLAQRGVRSMTLFNLKAAAALALAALATAGAGGLCRQALTSPRPESAAPDEPAPPGPRAPRADTHGDFLPDRALARLGTVRFRHGGPHHRGRPGAGRQDVGLGR